MVLVRRAPARAPKKAGRRLGLPLPRFTVGKPIRVTREKAHWYYCKALCDTRRVPPCAGEIIVTASTYPG